MSKRQTAIRMPGPIPYRSVAFRSLLLIIPPMMAPNWIPSYCCHKWKRHANKRNSAQ